MKHDTKIAILLVSNLFRYLEGRNMSFSTPGFSFESSLSSLLYPRTILEWNVLLFTPFPLPSCTSILVKKFVGDQNHDAGGTSS